MTIKSLLIGSAAALFAVSGAQAADAIVAADPEPVEYVRVCDAFGGGFFYIPGSENCLRISGYVRVRIGGTNNAGNNGRMWMENRARLNFDVRSDTEMGTLRGFVRLQGTQGGYGLGGGRYNVQIDKSFIQLGGFTVGYLDSLWAAKGGYGGHADNAIIGMNAANYGYQRRHQMSYSFSSGNMSAFVGLEEDGTGNWTPDFVAGVSGAMGSVNLGLNLAHDSSANQTAAMLGLTTSVGTAGSLILRGYWANGAGAYGANDNYGTGTYNWSILASYNHQMSSTVSVFLDGQYLSGRYGSTNNAGGQAVVAGSDMWRVTAGATWSPVANFSVRAELSYHDNNTAAIPGQTEAYLQFIRTF